MYRQILQFGKHSVVYGIGQILQRLVSFVLLPLYTTYLTTSDYGILEILNNTNAVLATLLGLGLLSGMYRSYYMYADEQRRANVTKTTLTAFGTFSVLASGILILFAKPLSGLLLSDTRYAPLLTLTLTQLMLTNILSIPFAALRARMQSIRFVSLSLAQFVVQAGSSVVLVAILRRGVYGSVEGTLLGQVAVLVLMLPFIVTTLRARFSRADFKEMLTFGLPLVPAMLASLSMTVSDRYFLRAFSTLDEVGVYALGYKIGLMVQILVLAPFTMSWGPVMWAVAVKPYAKQFYARILTYFSALSLYFALALSVLSPEIIRIMARRPAYWEAWQVVPWVTLSYVLYGLYYQLAVGINLKKKTQYLALIVGSSAVVNLLLNWILIPPWGMMGAAVATFVSYLVLAVLVGVVSGRLYPIAYEWSRLACLAIVAVLCYGTSLFVRSEPAFTAIGIKLVLLLLCPLALAALGFFRPEELARARKLPGQARGFLRTRLHRARPIEPQQIHDPSREE